jgi:hypothetical protein
VVLVGAFAIHGHAHGAELPEAANPLAYGVGFVIATGLLGSFRAGPGLRKNDHQASNYANRKNRTAASSVCSQCTQLRWSVSRTDEMLKHQIPHDLNAMIRMQGSPNGE